MSTYIFPADEAARTFKGMCDGYLQQHGPNPVLQAEPTLPACREIVKAVLDAQLTAMFKWASPNRNELDNTIVRYFPGFDPRCIDEASAWFWSQIMDHLIIHINEWVELAVPQRTWVVWHTKMIGQDIALEEGSDYRVLDWMRRKERGEFEGHE